MVIEIAGKDVAIQPSSRTPLLAPLIFGASDMEAYMDRLDLVRRSLDPSEFTGDILPL